MGSPGNEFLLIDAPNSVTLMVRYFAVPSGTLDLHSALSMIGKPCRLDLGTFRLSEFGTPQYVAEQKSKRRKLCDLGAIAACVYLAEGLQHTVPAAIESFDIFRLNL